jgi:hypothetical protein
MKLAITRLDANGAYETVVMRDDGVSCRLRGVGRKFAIPHDLAHFLVEKTLRLQHGFFGSIASGAVFPSMSYVGGRRKPRAAERSMAALKANAQLLSEAEVLVRIFNDTIEQGHSQTSPVLYERLKECWACRKPREITRTEIAEIFATYQQLLLEWRNLPVGATLNLAWSSQHGAQRACK